MMHRMLSLKEERNRGHLIRDAGNPQQLGGPCRATEGLADISLYTCVPRTKRMLVHVFHYRDIMLADMSGENFSKLLRHSLVLAAQRHVVLTQYGAGMNAGDTSKTYVHLTTRIDISTLW